MEWINYKISDLFEIQLSAGDNQANKLLDGKTPLVSAGTINNGICKFIDKPDIKSQLFNKNVITVDMFGKVYFHNYNFYTVSHGRINILVPKKNINKYVGLFIARTIEKRFEGKYSFSRMCSMSRLSKEIICLPANSTGEPNRSFMEDYIKNMEQKKVIDYIAFVTEKIKKIEYKIVPKLKDKKWKLFCIGELFELKKGKCSNASILNDGKIPYVGATNRNNGILKFVDAKEKMLSDGNCIVFIGAGDGSAGFSVYKKEKCICASSNVCGYNEYLNEYTGLFISACSDMNESKYSHGYSRNMERLSKDKVMLPVNDAGDPDYEYMEQYIKNFEYDKIVEYMTYIA